MKDKIVEILMVDLHGCDRDTIYCKTCRSNDSDDDVENRCDGCNRKQMYWGISRSYAEEIADEILKEINKK